MRLPLARARRLIGRTRQPAGGTADGALGQGLVRALEANEGFRRDGRVSGIFHPGRISFREISPEDSLHIVIQGDRVSAHVDEVSPLKAEPDGEVGYSWTRVIAHNLSGCAADVGRRLRGRHGEQRCSLGCEIVWVDDQIADLATDLQQGNPLEGLRPKPCA